MKKADIEKKVEEILLPMTDEAGFELVDVEYVKEGSNWYLRVFLDKEGGITIDDCESISRALEKKLDENDPIEAAYVLEVSSPGLDRQLKKEKDFVRYAGSLVDVKLYQAQNGSRDWQGLLEGWEDGTLTIRTDEGEEIRFQRKDVASVRLAVVF